MFRLMRWAIRKRIRAAVFTALAVVAAVVIMRMMGN